MKALQSVNVEIGAKLYDLTLGQFCCSLVCDE